MKRGSFEVAAGTLVVPRPLKANAARLVLDGPASAVVYPDTASAGTPRRDALASLARSAGSTLGAAGFGQSAGAVLRPAVTTGGAGIVAATGTATLGGRLDTPTPATLANDVTVLTASVVSGGFAAVTGGYEAVIGPADVTLRRPAGLQQAAEAPPVPAADRVAPAPLATAHGIVVPEAVRRG